MRIAFVVKLNECAHERYVMRLYLAVRTTTNKK